jgi:cytidine deaminase
MPHSRKFSDLAERDRKLIDDALAVSANAYAPYSGFAVGAAVRTKSTVRLGANLENASYGLSICAEVAAITSANSAGDYDIEAIAVIGHKFTKPRSFTQVVTPCGRCRQLISEAAEIAGCDVTVWSCSGDREQIIESKISELLLDAFGPKNLGLEQTWPRMRTDLRQSVKNLQHDVSVAGKYHPQRLRGRG